MRIHSESIARSRMLPGLPVKISKRIAGMPSLAKPISWWPATTILPSMFSPFRCLPQGVQNRIPPEVPFVPRDHHAVVRFRYRGENHVKSTARVALGLALCHQARPDQAGPVVERQYSPRKQRLWPLFACKPGFKVISLLAAGQFQNAALDFGDGQRGDKQIFVQLRSHPVEQRRRWLRLYGIADDVGVKEIACQRSTLRP